MIGWESLNPGQSRQPQQWRVPGPNTKLATKPQYTMAGDFPQLNSLKMAGRIWRLVAAVLIAVTVISVLVLAGTPPVSKDALTHHLALPKLYLAKGAMVELPDRVFSYYPMNLDLLYMVPLYLGNDIIAKYMHFCFALLTAGLVYRFLRNRIGTGYGLFGALLFLSTPVILKLSVTVYVDLGLVFFSTAALLALLKWREQNFKTGYLVQASIWCGLALGTKYHGLIVFFVLVNLLFLVSARWAPPRRGSALQALRHAGVFIVIALIVFSPWMIRNTLWKQNPIYPLFNGSIQALLNRAVDATPPAEVATPARTTPTHTPLNHFSYRANAYQESGVDIALIPLRIFFQGQDGTPQFFDGILTPLLLLLPIFAFAGIRADPVPSRVEKTVLLLFAVLFILIIFVSIDMRIRYILPAVPPLVILAAYGVRNLIARTAGMVSTTRRQAILVVVGMVIAGLWLPNFFYLAGPFKTIQPIDYISGRLTRDTYIEQFRPALSVHRYAARHLAKDAVILGLFLGNRSYYSDRDLVFDSGIFPDAVQQAADAGEIAVRLRAQGVTHLIVRYDLFVTWANDNFTAAEKGRVQTFLNDIAPSLYTGRGYGLHALSAG